MTSGNKDELLLNKTLTYANGYRELGMYKDALEEISRLPSRLAERLEAIQMKVAIFIDAQDWKSATTAAKNLLLLEPNNPGHLVNLAFVTRRSRNLSEAKAILADAALRFPQIAIVHYNLGCYACQESELETAKNTLAKAFSLDPTFLEIAKSDEDLIDLKSWLDKLEFA